jgi:hypothetical protein
MSMGELAGEKVSPVLGWSGRGKWTVAVLDKCLKTVLYCEVVL